MPRLSLAQQRQVEELLREKGERCGLCGSADLRCGNDARPDPGGGFAIDLQCTNKDADPHAGGIGLASVYLLSSDEARVVGL
jgi:hypothetical protein